MNQMVINNRKPHHGQSEATSAGVTLVAATNIHLHGRGQREGWFATRKRPRPTHHPGFGHTGQRFTESYRTIFQIV